MVRKIILALISIIIPIAGFIIGALYFFRKKEKVWGLIFVLLALVMPIALATSNSSDSSDPSQSTARATATATGSPGLGRWPGSGRGKGVELAVAGPGPGSEPLRPFIAASRGIVVAVEYWTAHTLLCPLAGKTENSE